MEAIMKRTIIRSTFMLLTVLAVAAGTKAQSAQQYAANIPFGFEAGGERYAAGKYRLGSMSANSPGAVGLREMRSGHVRVLGITQGEGTRNWDHPGTLTFRRVNGRYLLSEISTATFQMKVRSKKNIDQLADVASAEQVVTINLN
jgi:hypothetical protein